MLFVTFISAKDDIMKVWTEIRGDEVHHGNSSCWSWRKFAKFAESESEGNLRNHVGNFNFIGLNIMKSVRSPPPHVYAKKSLFFYEGRLPLIRDPYWFKYDETRTESL